MKSEYAIALVLRILGLLMAFQAVALVPMTVWWVFSEPFEGMATFSRLLPQVIGFLLSLALAYLLFMHGGRLARYVVPDDEQLDFGNMPLESADTVPVFRLLLRVVGALAMAWSVPELAGQGFARVTVYQFGPQHVWTQLVPSLLKFAIGLYLLRGGNLLVDLAYGTDDTPKEETPE
ncbi:MAG: hypothetical protein HOC74_01385 [Gemmatimonadetes bacterium]|jgi:hypothetical protein|nr:hypothetical protein [Gemmatimonadota bacterium]